jgi:hypothetical protein
MGLLGSIFISIMTFVLGIIASSYGAQVGKAIETRRDLLEKMREWVDLLVTYIHSLHQEILLSRSIWSEAELAEIKKAKISSSQRWLGVAQSLGSIRLFEAVERFTAAVMKFESYYSLQNKPDALTESRGHEGLEEIKILMDEVNASAQHLHAVITQEAIRGLPGWLVFNRISKK